MIDAVKSIAVNPVRKPFVGAGINRRSQRHLAMEAGIEDGNLRHRSEQFLNDLHAFQFSAIVKRSKGGDLGDRRFDLGRDHDGIFILGTAVDDAVPNNINLRRRGNSPRVAAPKTTEQVLDGLGARVDFCAIFSHRPRSHSLQTVRQRPPSHSILPSHKQAGGSSGTESPIS